MNIVVSGPDNLDCLYADVADDGCTRWTIHRGARRGAAALFYFTRPVYAIVARGRVRTKPMPHAEPTSVWHGRLMSDIDDLRLLAVPLPLAALKFCFPQWRYWWQPRLNGQVPSEYGDELAALVEQFTTPRVTAALTGLPLCAGRYRDSQDYVQTMMSIRRHRLELLAALARQHALAPADAVSYVALTAGHHSRMTFDEAIAALGGSGRTSCLARSE